MLRVELASGTVGGHAWGKRRGWALGLRSPRAGLAAPQSGGAKLKCGGQGGVSPGHSVHSLICEQGGLLPALPTLVRCNLIGRTALTCCSPEA